jgi:hypothetical protein
LCEVEKEKFHVVDWSCLFKFSLLRNTKWDFGKVGKAMIWVDSRSYKLIFRLLGAEKWKIIEFEKAIIQGVA